MLHTLLVLSLLAAPQPSAPLPASEFNAWLKSFRAEAKAAGVSDASLSALEGLEPIPRVLELYAKQPESKMTFDEYVAKVLTEQRIAEGRKAYAEHKATVDALALQYRVQPQFLMALWGAESAFGTVMGSYSIVGALATLASHGKRTTFFRKELLNALKILDAGHIAAADMKGSWAGAMGQCQFMPSTFLAYAADGNGDGKRDIWGERADVFASTANYLSKLKWKGTEPWGLEVKLPAKFDEKLLGLDQRNAASQWQALGVTTLAGKKLDSNLPKGSVIKPGGTTERAFLVFDNFRAVMKWNRSQYFATQVGLLSDALLQEVPVETQPSPP